MCGVHNGHFQHAQAVLERGQDLPQDAPVHHCRWHWVLQGLVLFRYSRFWWEAAPCSKSGMSAVELETLLFRVYNSATVSESKCLTLISPPWSLWRPSVRTWTWRGRRILWRGRRLSTRGLTWQVFFALLAFYCVYYQFSVQCFWEIRGIYTVKQHPVVICSKCTETVQCSEIFGLPYFRQHCSPWLWFWVITTVLWFFRYTISLRPDLWSLFLDWN